MSQLIGIAIGVGILGVVAGCAFFIRDKVRRLSSALFGTSDLIRGIKQRELETAHTPKSVSSAESMYGPLVLKDFPELNIQELKAMVEKTITEVFLAIENRNEKAFGDIPRVNAWILSKIEDLKGRKVQYDELRFHTTVLNRYIKTGDMATLKFQSAFQYIFKIDGKSSMTQDRVETEFVFILNEKELKGQNSVGLNCPNCGAPVKNLGYKVCEYCGSGLVELAKKVWTLNNIKEL